MTANCITLKVRPSPTVKVFLCLFFSFKSILKNIAVVMKQAMFLIAKTSLWSNGLAGFHPTPRLRLKDWQSQIFI
jgi:hypothetical protein